MFNSRWIIALLIWIGLSLPATAAGWLPLAAAASGGCSQYTSLAGRMDGSQNASAVSTLICGMVTDGTYSLIDGLYVFATNSTANANLNWAQNAFNLTTVGTETFSANNGYTGDASTGYFTTGFIPSSAGGNFTLNSASIGGCVLTSSTASQSWATLGTNIAGGADNSYMIPLFGGNSISYDLNGDAFPSLAESNAQGSYIVARTTNASLVLYQNGSSVATPSDVSQGVSTVQFYIGGNNNNGATQYLSGYQIAYAFFGGGLTGTQAGNIYTRLHTYLTAVGAASGC